MTITILNNHNKEIYEMTPAKGCAKQLWYDLYSYVRTIDRTDHETDTTAGTDLMVAMFRSFTVGVN